MERKKVLLITYYWPPGGGAGVHRWLRFSKYFQELGADLTVYCPEDAVWQTTDAALVDQVPESVTVIRRGIFEPQKYIGRKGTGIGFTQDKKAGPLKRLIIWIRGNLLIPDSRKYWIKPSTRFLRKYLTDHPEIDTLISTGPPHSLHLIAHNLKKSNGLKWIADFRDPWTQIDFYQDLLPGKRADKKHKRLERIVLASADEVVTVSNHCAYGLEEIVNRKVHVITNGFPFEENPTKVKLDEKFTISHFGTMPFARNPRILWEALKSLLYHRPELTEHLEIHLVGSVDFNVIASYEENGLKDFVTLVPNIPHNESVSAQKSSQLLLLSANQSGNIKGILTGKFFEYLAADRPIIGIGDKEGDLAAAFKDLNCGHFSGFEEKNSLESYLHKSFDHFLNGEIPLETKGRDKYHSRSLAAKFIELL